MFNEFLKIAKFKHLLVNYDDLMLKTAQVLALPNKNIVKWQSILEYTRTINSGNLSYNKPYIDFFKDEPCSSLKLEECLAGLKPWRKGPYKIGNLIIDSEWRGDMKWARIIEHISPLDDKLVLDVGCGNGYFSYHMALCGAKFVLGLEPFLLFNYQFYSLYNLINKPPNIALLPLRVEQINNKTLFDTIFSMGVLYHQKSAIEHLLKLKSLLKNDGELVLETLVVPGNLGYSLMPKKRYAMMRNVWFLPSKQTLISYIERCGFSVKLVNSNTTTTDEQKTTKWLGDNARSLVDFLDTNNPKYTIEGYPSPTRVICICKKALK